MDGNGEECVGFRECCKKSARKRKRKREMEKENILISRGCEAKRVSQVNKTTSMFTVTLC